MAPDRPHPHPQPHPPRPRPRTASRPSMQRSSVAAQQLLTRGAPPQDQSLGPRAMACMACAAGFVQSVICRPSLESGAVRYGAVRCGTVRCGERYRHRRRKDRLVYCRGGPTPRARNQSICSVLRARGRQIE